MRKCQKISLLIIMVIMMVSLIAGIEWFDSDYANRKADNITFNKGDYENLTNFTYLANNGSVDTSTITVQADCDDLIFVNETGDQQFPHYFSTRDDSTYGCGSTTTLIYVKADIPQNLTGNYMYYNNPSATNQENYQEAGGDWELRLHFDNGTGNNETDFSPNGYNSTLATGSWETSCPIGYCRTGKTEVPLGVANFVASTDSFSISIWANYSGYSATNVRYLNGFINSGNGRIVMSQTSGSSGIMTFQITDIGGTSKSVNTLAGYNDGDWHHFVFVNDGSINKMIIYVDGVEENSDTTSFASGFDNNIGWCAGQTAFETIGNCNTDSATDWKGDYDELYIIKRTLSINEVKALFEQGQNNFSSLGAEESQGNSAPTIVFNETIPPTPSVDDFINISAIISDDDEDTIDYVNFSVIHPNQSIIFENKNGTFASVNATDSNWTSDTFQITDSGLWQWNLTSQDNNSNDVSTANGEFTVANSLAPNITITNPLNNSLSIESSIDLNFSSLDDTTLEENSACWYELDDSGTNVTIDNCANVTLTSLSLTEHNITVYRNDSSGNIGENRTDNFTITTDTTNPTITSNIITTVDSKTITLNYTSTDNEAVDSTWYNITKTASGDLEGNAFILLSNSSQAKDIVVDLYTDYTLTLATNDSSNNGAIEEINFTTSESSTSPTGGGGGVSKILKGLGETCSKSSDCSSGLCDLNSLTDTKNTCVLSTQLCGNNFCDKEYNENTENCRQDCNIFSTIQSGQTSKFLSGMLILGVLIVIYLIYQPQIDKTTKNILKKI